MLPPMLLLPSTRSSSCRIGGGRRRISVLLLSLACVLPVRVSSSASPPPSCTTSGYFLSPTAACSPCPAGYYCPEGSNHSYPCPPGTYQQLGQQETCLDCPPNAMCQGNASTAFTACPAGRVTPARSTSCDASRECDWEAYYLNLTSGSCVRRTVLPCNLDTHYEAPTPLNRTQEIACVPLTPCDTAVRLLQESPVEGAPLGVQRFDPLRQYILRYSTRYADRECWTWKPCATDEYVAQLPVDDGAGFLLQPLVCRPLSRQKSNAQYLLVDGSATRDR